MLNKTVYKILKSEKCYEKEKKNQVRVVYDKETMFGSGFYSKF